MIRKLFLVATLLAATCAAGLMFGGSSLVPSSSAMGQNSNNMNRRMDRDMDNRMGRRRHRRHERRWHRRHRRNRRNGNMNR